MPGSPDSSIKGPEAPTAKGSALCLACGLCCRGVFFVNTIDPKDFGIDRPEARTSPGCLLHVSNRCSIYDHSLKPGICSEWECPLLKQLMDDVVTLESAGSLGGDQLLDISSFLLLVDCCLKPFQPGLFRDVR